LVIITEKKKMKKAIIMLAIMLAATALRAQVKKDTVKAPVFKIDTSKVYDIHLKLRQQDIDLFGFIIPNGAKAIDDTDFRLADRQALKKRSLAFIELISQQKIAQDAADKLAFYKIDSLKFSNPKKSKHP
jgi:hypothetical protein